jgi:hypothetical protein
LVEGLTTPDTFNHRLEYGQMWHTCEEWYANPRRTDWRIGLTNYCQDLCRRYKTQQEQVQHWYNVCRVQFPIYVDFWAKHPDVKQRTPLLQEQAFDVSYQLPSGRRVRLRGKWDSVDLVGKGKDMKVYLQENKTKGEINEEQLKRQLTFDLQTMFYLVALRIDQTNNMGYLAVHEEKGGFTRKVSIAGVRYNVIRRPLSGGKDSIKPLKGNAKTPAETMSEYYNRLGGLITDHPEYYFMRWKVEVSPQDVRTFCHQFLDPCLEQLLDWWNSVSKLSAAGDDPFADTDKHQHFRTPYGIYNPPGEGRATDLDEYLATGSKLGLENTSTIFPELT